MLKMNVQPYHKNISIKKTFSTHSFIFECIEENWLKEKIKDMCNVAH